MEAAAHGKSTLVIPKKVGKEFVAADKKKKKVAVMQRVAKNTVKPVDTVLS